ncbi:hypothetical protein DFO55_11887 [Grimontella sp. AG753]|nr:hypothetical protein DFO55_11887 [Grimontella sp. AG753]
MQVDCVISRVPEWKFWRSQHQIKWNVVSEVKAIPSMQKVLLTQLFHAYEPSQQKLVAE